jgi:A/G-specific adenine glycosylase
LEGNTQRVFSRWIALREHPTEKPANALLWQLAEAMLPRTGSGTFNQAAMELGALVCTPKSPQCDRCPVQQSCQAAKLGLQAEIPGKIKQIDYQARTEFALVIRRQQGGRRQYLLRPLPEGGRWAGLWDFPRPTETELESVDQATQWLGERLGALVSPGPRLKTIRHAVTRYRIALHVHQADLHAPQADLHAPLSDQDDGSGKADSLAGTRNRDSSGAPRPDDKGFQPPRPWQWVACDEVNELPMSVTGRKIHDFLKSNRQNVLPLG